MAHAEAQETAWPILPLSKPYASFGRGMRDSEIVFGGFPVAVAVLLREAEDSSRSAIAAERARLAERPHQPIIGIQLHRVLRRD